MVLALTPLMQTPILLHNGHWEGVKAGVHGLVLGTVAVCAVYNFAAWLVRREPHSAVNAGLYAAIIAWECVHVRHHIASRPARNDLAAQRTRVA